ncbi:hypothetical protein SAMN05421780_107198 [Flexibacter flexilis DSM 6793]|uniref:Ig-like domain (Group 3) n=1 Tax=Flexibacter flexilis DSM 6793 TaxID=927664 RepID=A0A1I1L2Z7_9BACT|nr:hypothetical protein [Flexibacter flexilis]SFC63980.1 hypothetical protein SAMN05421780_107198 [Flexibacter flexilis DSM 6793]
MKHYNSTQFFIMLAFSGTMLLSNWQHAVAQQKPNDQKKTATPATTLGKPSGAIVAAFGSIKIDNGAKFTTNKDKKVNLIISLQRPDPTRYKMMVSNEPSFAGKDWEHYLQMKPWVLDGEDGVKNVFVKFLDPAGNESEAISSSITLDRIPPSDLSIVINEDAQYCIDPALRVKLKINAKDAKTMRISNSPNFAGNPNFENYSPSKDFVLAPPTPPEGRRTVYAQFKDEAGNISESVQDTIRLDIKEPSIGSVKIAIGNGVKQDISRLVCNSKDKKITLNISSVGATKMIVVQGSAAPPALVAPTTPQTGTNKGKTTTPAVATKKVEGVEAYATVKEITLDGEDGEKTIQVYFGDEAGNRTKIPAITKIILDRQGPTNGLLKIDDNKEYTINPQHKVNLKLEAKGEPFQMMISNKPDFAGASWEGYTTIKNQWTLEGEDGEKTVYVKFKDRADNESEIFSDKIIQDTKPPIVNKFVIDNDSAYTTNPAGKVNIQIDVTEAETMILSNTPLNPLSYLNQPATNSGAWKKYNTSESNYQLDMYEGEKTIYALFKDKAGNISKLAFDKITFDKIAPSSPKIIIEDNAPWIINADKKVKLTLSADQSPAYVMVSNNDKFTGASWEHFAPVKKDWVLDGEDGEKTVYVKYKDKAGNISAVANAKTKMDRKAPTEPKIIINSDSVYTRSIEKKVNLKISAKDATQMRISQNPSFPPGLQGWETFITTKPLILEGGDGNKSVYIQFKDQAGNISATASDSIRLDRTAPIPGTLVIDDGAEFSNNKEKKVNLKFSANGAKEMMISGSAAFTGAKWEPYSPTKANYVLEGNEDGPRIIYAKFRDDAGNVSNPPIQGNIKLKRKF